MEAPPPPHCPGIGSDEAGKASPCAGCPNQKICSSGESKQASIVEAQIDIPLIKDRLGKIKHIILVISGKGGTGKSTMSCLLARCLADDPNVQVGLLDIDICGPSAPRMFGLEGEQVHQSSTGWSPVYVSDNLAVMSCGFLLNSLDDAVIWRGPKKTNMIKQFLRDVEWDELDYLIIDTPPGTSDEHISIVNYLKQTELANIDGAIIVTTPQEISLLDVRKQIDFCRRINLRILGVLENMSLFTCPKCSKTSSIFAPTSGGAQKMANDYELPLLGKIPLNPIIGRSCDNGQALTEENHFVGGDNVASQQQQQQQQSLLNNIFMDVKTKLLDILKQ